MPAKQTKNNPLPLINEDHPDDYDGYPFITLIQHHDEHVLTIVDNINDKYIKAYVLDWCNPAGIDEQQLIEIAAEWYYNNSNRFPISFEFSRRGLTEQVSALYRHFAIGYVTRVIGPLPEFEMSTNKSIRRRKRKPVPNGVEVTYNLISDFTNSSDS